MTVQIFSARVKAGAIVPEGDVVLTEGAQVTVITDSVESSFDATPQQEIELLESIAEAERDDVVRAADLLSRLAR